MDGWVCDLLTNTWERVSGIIGWIFGKDLGEEGTWIRTSLPFIAFKVFSCFEAWLLKVSYNDFVQRPVVNANATVLTREWTVSSA
jgi:hypothetical protein